MRTVWKCSLLADTGACTRLEFPKGARILCVQLQRGCPCIWAEVDSEAELEERWFQFFRTGYPIPDDRTHRYHYIGTCCLDSWESLHLYERVPASRNRYDRYMDTVSNGEA